MLSGGGFGARFEHGHLDAVDLFAVWSLDVPGRKR
jgi:hypothetical protein